MAMSDQQQPDQPPAGAPGAWPPPQPQQPGWQAPQQPGWQAPQQPGWNQAPQQPGWQAPQQPGWQAPQQPGYPAPYAPPVQGGYPPPLPYSQPAGYPPAGYGMPRYAGFWIRFVAYIIDAIIWFVALIVAGISIIIVVGIVLFPLVLFCYWPYLWWKRGATFGQSALGLRVVRAIDGGPIDGGMAAIRAIVFLAELFFGSYLIGLIGLIWAAFEPRKRAWHDMAAGTVVIHIN
jgi:uncharacterized RDD family membrane protein YckC